MWWQPELGGTFPLSAHYRTDGSAAAFVDGPLRTLTDAFDVSAKVLWGNVASAINGAATMIATTRPELADRAASIAADLLDTPLAARDEHAPRERPLPAPQLLPDLPGRRETEPRRGVR